MAGRFTLQVAKNIARLETEEERREALLAVHENSRELVEKTVNAIRSRHDDNRSKP